MKLEYFALELNSDDYKIKNEPGSEYPYRILPIVSDFSFQTRYMCDYIQNVMIKEKLQSKNFNLITLRARKNASSGLNIKKHLKSLEVEVFFDEIKYRQLYPKSNIYPVKNSLIPPIDYGSFDNFLISMVMEGLEKLKFEPFIPYQSLVDAVLDFKSIGCKNEWLFKTKTINEHGIKVSLWCKLTPDHFSLYLIVYKKKQIYKKEILRELPSSICYKHQFKDIIYKNDTITITKDLTESPPLIQLDINDILANV